MTNFEKYKDELCIILSHYVGVSDDKPRICNDLSCKTAILMTMVLTVYRKQKTG